ncbi:MAG: 50S ribosomal protein L21 [Candidatus Levyibacteriota bacterium]
MEYAVIKTGGKQYRVSAGDVLEIAKLPQDADSTITFEDVLLLVSDSAVKIGKPTLASVKVKAKLLEQKKGEKIDVYKFKAKARYRRKIGFRELLSKVVIEKIESGEKASAPARPAKKTPTKK